MNLQWLLAGRFLVNTHQSRPVSLFSIVAVLGIAFSVALFLLIDTVMNGFSQHLSKTLLGFDAPLILEGPPGDLDGIRRELDAFMKEHPRFRLQEVTSYQFDGLIQIPNDTPSGVKVRSVGGQFFNIKKDRLKIYWQDGYDLEAFLKDPGLVIVGEAVYERLRFLPGDQENVLLTHPFADLGPSGDIEPREEEFRIAGIFSTGHFDFDNVYVLVSDASVLGMAQPEMLRTQIFLYPQGKADPGAIKRAWTARFPASKATLQTWYERNQNLFKAMRLEKIVFSLLFLIIVLISCFNLAGVITIFGLSKSVDAAILKTLGLSVSALRLVHMKIAALLSGVGALLGVCLALLAAFFLKRSQFLVSDVYVFSNLALEVNSVTVIALLLMTPALAALIAYWPADRIAKKSIMDVMRLS